MQVGQAALRPCKFYGGKTIIIHKNRIAGRGGFTCSFKMVEPLT